MLDQDGPAHGESPSRGAPIPFLRRFQCAQLLDHRRRGGVGGAGGSAEGAVLEDGLECAEALQIKIIRNSLVNS